MQYEKENIRLLINQVMRQILFIAFWGILSSAVALTACSPDNDPLMEEMETPVPNPDSYNPDEGKDDPDNNNDSMNRSITIRTGNANFSATLEDNPAAKAFAALLPMTVNMTEMNGNEKYYNLPQSLPTETHRPGTIRAGDLLLWGSNTVVLFYESFSSSYSYTRLGRVDNPDGLAAALGGGNVSVTFDNNMNQ